MSTQQDALRKAREALMEAYFGVGNWPPKANSAIALIDAALASQPAEAPAGQGERVTDEMVAAYLDANTEYWRQQDEMPAKTPSKWRNGTPQEATRVSLEAALRLAQPAQAPAVPEGFVLLPKKATPQMLLAAGYRLSAVGASDTGHEMYAALIAAAPTAQPSIGTIAHTRIPGMSPIGDVIATAQPKQESAADAQQAKDAVRDAISQVLTSVYVCGRVWSAWQAGTMTEDDFIPAADSDEVLNEITDAAIAALSSTAREKKE